MSFNMKLLCAAAILISLGAIMSATRMEQQALEACLSHSSIITCKQQITGVR